MKRIRSGFLMVTACAISALLAADASGSMLTLNPSADTSLWHRDGVSGYGNTNFGTQVDLDVYHFDNNLAAYSYIQFDLSTLGIVQE